MLIGAVVARALLVLSVRCPMKLPSLSAAAILLSACVSTNASLIDPTVHLARTCPAAIKLLHYPDRVGQPYREVAILNAKGESNWSDEEDMIE